jgi:hypothetical protein
LLLSTQPVAAQTPLSVRLSPGVRPPRLVGTPLTWTARLGTRHVEALYRFEVSALGGDWKMVRDYGKSPRFRWTTLDQGSYRIRVSVLEPESGATAVASALVSFVSRVTDGTPVVSATEHPLVAIYSAPPCIAGSVQVRFRAAAEGGWQTTPSQSCRGARSLNFYVAGMRAKTTYVLQQLRLVGARIVATGPELAFETGDPRLILPGPIVANAPDSVTSTENGILLTAFMLPVPLDLHEQVGAVATDLAGNLLWYDPGLVGPEDWDSSLVRVAPGGTMMLLLGRQPNSFGQTFREIDLAGVTRRETTVAALNLQLARMGKDPISYLSHEALRLPNDHTLLLAPVERILTDVQGAGPRNVLGYMILDLDPNLQIAWSWNTFDSMDPRRQAVMREICGEPGCGPLRLWNWANDWIHANSLVHLPDGNLLISMRHQDWIVKIDYRDGAGSGDVIWRLGRGGDFTLDADGPWPWFSHQHGVHVVGDEIVVFDNGNTRRRFSPSQRRAASRGQVLTLDETARTAKLLVNADLGAFSVAWGNGQRLANGNYFFVNGYIGPLADVTSRSQEVTPDGLPNYKVLWEAGAYRAFRMKDMYTP